MKTAHLHSAPLLWKDCKTSFQGTRSSSELALTERHSAGVSSERRNIVTNISQCFSLIEKTQVEIIRPGGRIQKAKGT